MRRRTIFTKNFPGWSALIESQTSAQICQLGSCELHLGDQFQPLLNVQSFRYSTDSEAGLNMEKEGMFVILSLRVQFKLPLLSHWIPAGYMIYVGPCTYCRERMVWTRKLAKWFERIGTPKAFNEIISFGRVIQLLEVIFLDSLDLWIAAGVSVMVSQLYCRGLDVA